jgi:hypothetical protein
VVSVGCRADGRTCADISIADTASAVRSHTMEAGMSNTADGAPRSLATRKAAASRWWRWNVTAKVSRAPMGDVVMRGSTVTTGCSNADRLPPATCKRTGSGGQKGDVWRG